MTSDVIGLVLLTVLCAVMLSATAWIGMSRELCRRDYSPEAYAEMRLDCDDWRK